MSMLALCCVGAGACSTNASGPTTPAPQDAPNPWEGFTCEESAWAEKTWGSRGAVVFEDQMGQAYKLYTLKVSLDGERVLDCAGEKKLIDVSSPIPVYEGPMEAGPHKLEVEAGFRGHGFGIFQYLKSYRFDVRGTYEFEVPPGVTPGVKIVAYERGCQTIEDRPQVRFIRGHAACLAPYLDGECVFQDDEDADFTLEPNSTES